MYIHGKQDSHYFLVSRLQNNSIRVNRFFKQQKSKAKISDVRLFNNSYYCHSHLIANDSITGDHRYLIIWRDPREIIISYLRWQKYKGNITSFGEEDIIRILHNSFYELRGSGNFVDSISLYTDWLTADNACNISKKNIHTDAELERIQKFIGTSNSISYPQQRDLLFNNNNLAYTEEKRTQMATPTYWQDYWTDNIDTVWNKINGPKLVNKIKHHVDI